VSKTRPLIAVVDDEEPVRKALTRLLRSADLDVETFPSGVEFLESLPTRRPDCVVLDLHMPLMDGFEVQARLAESSAPVPVVTITGHHRDARSGDGCAPRGLPPQTGGRPDVARCHRSGHPTRPEKED
jgi:FixJ family two-component response regulator